MINMKKWLRIIGLILICELAGLLGSLFTSSVIPTWYASLQKPFFSPPNWLFAPVWTTLFALMGLSLYFVLQNKKIRNQLIAFSVQMVLNIIWSLLFFGLKSPFYALVEIIFLWFSILTTIVLFYRTSKKAAYLLVPYILWVSLASILNYYVWMLNL
jgi:tryptophan-rich sensory protein